METSGSSVQSVERALAILEFVDGSRRQWYMSEISRKLDIPKSTGHMLVLTLERAGYLERLPNSRGYRLGLRARALGHNVTRHAAMAELALPHMKLLAEQTKLTVHLAVRDDNQAIYIQKADSPASNHFDTYVGKRINLHCTAVGKVILAHEQRNFGREYLQHRIFSRHTVHTITSPAELCRTMESTLRRGCAIDDEEEELDVRCLSVPVFSRLGQFVAALGVAGTTAQVPIGSTGTLIAAVRQTAAGILNPVAP